MICCDLLEKLFVIYECSARDDPVPGINRMSFTPHCRSSHGVDCSCNTVDASVNANWNLSLLVRSRVSTAPDTSGDLSVWQRRSWRVMLPWGAHLSTGLEAEYMR